MLITYHLIHLQSRAQRKRIKMPGGSEERDTELLPGQPVRTFTWKELSKFNTRENAHVAYRGKVKFDL